MEKKERERSRSVGFHPEITLFHTVFATAFAPTGGSSEGGVFLNPAMSRDSNFQKYVTKILMFDDDSSSEIQLSNYS